MTTITRNGAAERIPVAVLKPNGAGPFPAVVIVHDCSGLGQGSSGAPGRWAKELVARGYVVALPDSFSTRGYAQGVCVVAPAQRLNDVSPDQRARDANGALAYVRSLPYVDGRRVGLMGGSHGGTTTLAAMALRESGEKAPARAADAGFVAAVALYPRCATRMGSWRADMTGVYRPVAPVLILIGALDDWTPADACQKLAQVAQRDGQPVAIKVYPGAHHSFDSAYPVRYVAARINPSVAGGRGATTGGDPTAWADSIRKVTAFFARHLQAAGQ